MIRIVLIIFSISLFLNGCVEKGLQTSTIKKSISTEPNRIKVYLPKGEYSYTIPRSWVKEDTDSISSRGEYYSGFVADDTIVINVSFEDGQRIEKAHIIDELNYYNSAESIVLDDCCIQTIGVSSKKVEIFIVDFKGLLDDVEKLICMIYLVGPHHTFVQRMILPLSYDVAVAHSYLGDFVLGVEKGGIPFVYEDDELHVVETDCFDF